MPPSVQARATCGPTVSTGRKLLVSVVFVLWLATSLVAVSPRLHHWLHTDAQSTSHDCVFTHVSKGQLLGVAPGLVTVAPSSFLVRLALSDESRFVPAALYRWSPSRAPPPVFSSLAVVS